MRNDQTHAFEVAAVLVAVCLALAATARGAASGRPAQRRTAIPT